MEHTMIGSPAMTQVRMPTMPLAMVAEGAEVEVVRVAGSLEMRRHLAELGFVEGAQIKVISRAGADMVVSVKGSSMALGRDMTMKITTR